MVAGTGHSRDLLGMGSKLRVLSHELAHDRTGIGRGVVLHGILQRILFNELSDLFHDTSPIACKAPKGKAAGKSIAPAPPCSGEES